MTDLRIAAPAAVAWIVAIAVLPFPSAIFGVSLALWCGAVVVLIVAAVGRRQLLVMLAVALAAAALVTTSAMAHEGQRHPRVLGREASTMVAGDIVTTQTVTRTTKHFTATLTRVGTTEVAVPVMVFDAAPKRRVEIGTTLVVSGSLKATPPEDSISYLLFASAPAHVTSKPPWYLAWANHLRSDFAWAATSLPGDGGDLLPGLAIGDTVAVSPSLSADMKTSSLTHLTAVSGANCAVLIGLVMFGGGVLGVRRGVRIAGALVVLVGFVVLVTPGPSVLRAAVMCGLMLASAASGRPTRGLPVVGLATIILLTMDPWLARDYGFALSVLATAGLMVLGPPLSRFLSRWMPEWLAVIVAIPIAAQAACQPVLILLSPTLPLYGVVANLLAEPAAPAATVLGLLACVTLPLVPALGQAIAAIAWVPSAWIAAVARLCATLPGARLPWAGGIIGALLLAVITALVVAVVIAPLSRRGRRIAAMALTVCVVGSLVVIGTARVTQQLQRPPDWEIADCDIGQGDAMVVRSAGKIALMDTGPSEPLLKACLDTLGISHIDLLVLSHYDLDHVAGTPVVDGMVTRALVGPSSGAARDDEILGGLLDGGTRVDRVSRGVTGTLGDLRWSVIWPPAPLPDGVLPGNDACVTVLFEPLESCENGCLSSLFVGDLGQRAQDNVLEANPALPHVDVIEVAHHGSADQSEAFYQRVSASVGIIGVGKANRYGHPTQHLLDILGSVGTAVARTDTEGLVLLSPSRSRGDPPGTVSIWSQHPDTGGPG
jgi:competence protein ComEC